MDNSQARETIRKRLISEIYNNQFKGNCVLLEEFRWRVFLEEYALKNRLPTEMPISYQKSFSRTIREHSYNFEIYRFIRSDLTPSIFLARSAAYRCVNIETYRIFEVNKVKLYIKFKNLREKDIYYKPNEGIDKANLILDKRQMFYCWLCLDYADNYEDAAFHKACIPVTSPLCVVARKSDRPKVSENIQNMLWNGCEILRIDRPYSYDQTTGKATKPRTHNIDHLNFVHLPGFFEVVLDKHLKEHKHSSREEALQAIIRQYIDDKLILLKRRKR